MCKNIALRVLSKVILYSLVPTQLFDVLVLTLVIKLIILARRCFFFEKKPGLGILRREADEYSYVMTCNGTLPHTCTFSIGGDEAKAVWRDFDCGRRVGVPWSSQPAAVSFGAQATDHLPKKWKQH